MNTLDIQARLMALGFDPGPIDGVMGVRTRRAMQMFKRRKGHAIEDDIHPSGLHRVVLHWTAGAAGLIDLEREHYHLIIGQDARPYMGKHRPEANGVIRAAYAAHTRGLNTGSIGVALDAMADATERPWWRGSNPITRPMLDTLAREVADLCLTYRIPVSRWTVLSHAEVQPTLGVWQRNKWDIAWIPEMDGPGDPVVVGDELRQMIRAQLPRSVAAA